MSYIFWRMSIRNSGVMLFSERKNHFLWICPGEAANTLLLTFTKKRDDLMETPSQHQHNAYTLSSQQKSSQSNAVLGICIGIVIPALLYQVLTQIVHVPAALALLLCGLPGTGWWLFWLIRLRTFDLLTSLAPLFLLTNGLLLVSHADQRVTQLNVSFVSGIVGAYCMVTLFFPRSLLPALARLLTTGGSPRNHAPFALFWQVSSFRVLMRFCVILWGSVLGLEAATTTLLAFRLSLPTIATLLPWLNYGIPVVLAHVSTAFWHRARRQQRRSSEQAEKHVF